jgi:hypothetical protein
MSPRDMPSKNAPHTTTVPVDIEHGYRDQITPSASSSLTPKDLRSKAATPTPRRSLEIEENVPRQRASHTSRTWARLETKLPAPVAQYSRIVVNWIRGPESPRAHRINPLFERIQTFPARQLARLPRWARGCVWIVAFVIWAVLFAVILTNYSLPSTIGGFGAPVTLSCVTNLWYMIHPPPLQHFSKLTPLQAQRPVVRTRWSQLSPFRQLFVRVQLPRRLPRRPSAQPASHWQHIYKLPLAGRRGCA